MLLILFCSKIEGFVNEKPFLQYYISKQRECVLRMAGLSISHVSYGIALQKKSPWLHMIATSILKFQDSGKLLEIDKKWLSGGCSSNGNLSIHHESYSSQHFSGLFVILLTASVIAFVILVLEHLYHRYHERVLNPLETHVKKWKSRRKKSSTMRVDGGLDSTRPSQVEANKEISARNHTIDQWRLSNQL